MNSTGNVNPEVLSAIAPPAATPGWWLAFQGIWSITWRRKVTLVPLLTTLALFIGFPLLGFLTISDGDTERFFEWTVDFYLHVGLPIFCLAVFGDIIRDELQADTMSFLITRPITRAQLFLLKYLSQLIIVQGLALVFSLVFFLVGFLRHIPDLVALFPWFALVQALAVLSYGALSALLGLLARKYLVLGVIYGFVVEVGIARIPTNINSLAMSRHIKTILANNNSIFEHYKWLADGTWMSLGIMVLAALIFLVAGALLFTFREYHSTEEMQK